MILSNACEIMICNRLYPCIYAFLSIYSRTVCKRNLSFTVFKMLIALKINIDETLFFRFTIKYEINQELSSYYYFKIQSNCRFLVAC